jgi:starch synthase
MKTLIHLSTEYLGIQKMGGLADYMEGLSFTLADEFSQTIILPHLGKVTYPAEAELQQEEVTVSYLGIEFPFKVMSFYGANKRIRFVVFDGANAALDSSKYNAYELIDDFPYMIWGKAVSTWLGLGERVDVLCTHDWQSAGIYAYLPRQLHEHSLKVHVIHNFGYQGLISDRLELEAAAVFDFPTGNLKSLQSLGVVAADKVLTVSGAHLQELLDPNTSINHVELLLGHREKLVAITNGLNARQWSPVSSRYLPTPFDESHLSERKNYRQKLVQKLGIPASQMILLFQSRPIADKGIELILDELDSLLQLPVVLLFHADIRPYLSEYYPVLRQWQLRFPQKLFIFESYQEERAHHLLASCDVLLMPSLYEPCGQLQLYAMKFGALPVVHATGGLNETVQDESLEDGNGWKFWIDSPFPITRVLERALDVFLNRPQRWEQMQHNAMSVDHSWCTKKAAYIDLLNSSK